MNIIQVAHLHFIHLCVSLQCLYDYLYSNVKPLASINRRCSKSNSCNLFSNSYLITTNSLSLSLALFAAPVLYPSMCLSLIFCFLHSNAASTLFIFMMLQAKQTWPKSFRFQLWAKLTSILSIYTEMLNCVWSIQDFNLYNYSATLPFASAGTSGQNHTKLLPSSRLRQQMYGYSKNATRNT